LDLNIVVRKDVNVEEAIHVAHRFLKFVSNKPADGIGTGGAARQSIVIEPRDTSVAESA
jgi:hypothetical protein